MLNTNQLNNLREAAKSAVACELTTGVPCELTIAQWALESGWGDHSPGNNCFGIKHYTGAFGKQLMSTTEYFTLAQAEEWLKKSMGRLLTVVESIVDEKGRRKYLAKDWFASFENLVDCFVKHSEILIKGVYGNLLGTYKLTKDLNTYIEGVAHIYATDPDYHKKIMSLISKPEVQAALAEARSQ